jgi:hypothetical protein
MEKALLHAWEAMEHLGAIIARAHGVLGNGAAPGGGRSRTLDCPHNRSGGQQQPSRGRVQAAATCLFGTPHRGVLGPNQRIAGLPTQTPRSAEDSGNGRRLLLFLQ